MNIYTTFIAAILLTTGANAFSLSPKNENVQPTPGAAGPLDRRAALTGVTTAAAAAIAGGSLLAPVASVAAGTGGAEAFVATYTDPINHPGGTRTIKLLDGKVGDYQLAEVQGGGGRGEPASYVLPAAIIGDRTIVIDFSPKGGPRDFVGILEKGDIRFLKDGNRWPRQ